MLAVYSDNTGRPRRVLAPTGALRWAAANRVFDRVETTDTIGGLKVGFPGQYQDTESNLWQNWHRTYDSSIGRYTQSDRIGLGGGVNTYAYAYSNPVSLVDPTGEIPLPLLTGSIGAVAGAIGNIVGQMSGCKPFSLGDVALAAIGGGVSGALSVIPGGKAGAAALGAATNLGQYVYSSAAKNEGLTAVGAVTNLATGAVGGAIAGVVPRGKDITATILMNTSLGAMTRNYLSSIVGNAPVTDIVCGCGAK